MMSAISRLALVVVMSLLAIPAVGQSCLQWVNVTPEVTGPEPRSNFGLAYDSNRDRVVIFGGEWSGSTTTGLTARGDTLEWDGGAWVFASTTGPSPRWGSAMAFDAGRGVTVLFGGSMDGDIVLAGETWEWSGAAWSRASIVGPAPRRSASMAYDEINSRIVLFGGSDVAGSELNDTWAWDGVTWTLVSQSGPSPRQNAAMAFDAQRGSIILFGGEAAEVASSQTWELTGSRWTLLTSAGPSARYSHTLTRDPSDGSLYLVGGAPDFHTSLNDVWRWHAGAWHPQQSIGGVDRREHGACINSQGELLIFGGKQFRRGNRRPDLSKWSNGSWSVRWAENPGARFSHSIAYDQRRRVFVMFGGGPNHFGDTWEWDGRSWELRSLTGPSPRSSHHMRYHPVRQTTILFGGSVLGANGNANQSNDMWEWDGDTWVQITGTPWPGVSSNLTMVYDDARDVLTMLIQTQSLYQTWTWDGGIWALRNSRGSTFRGAFAFDSARGLGVVDLSDNGQTYLWNGTAWTFSGASLPRRSSPGILYDSYRERVVLFGGFVTIVNEPSQRVDLMWEWDGSSWHSLSIPRPQPRSAMGFDFDTDRGIGLLHGGQGNATLYGDLWELRSSLLITHQPQPVEVQAGRTAEFSITAASASPIAYQWRRDGQPLSNGGNIFGADTDTLTIDPAGLGDQGDYDCIATSDCGDATSTAATLTVTCFADCDVTTGPGVLDVFDFLCWLNEYFRETPYACECDLSTGPGVCDIFDYVCFGNAFSAGCQ